ncbi:hypothetical protein [Paenibacillus glycinis]|uniref:Uncharacterized protein n=1 Tax=Paenibacillus glycinis TaxID=2697035 RepID=A0ABW9XPB2_9BACL|nr:hypothetical protein [Paenibacillus glycinis]NBD24470.1 hypothetical protein [Paenibacillus glycinis]
MLYLSQVSDMETWYFEIDSHNRTAYRQVMHTREGEWVGSNRRHPRFGYFLSDQDVIAERGEEITKQAFEAFWELANAPHWAAWNNAKRALPIGADVEGTLDVFYPHGVICSIPAYWAVGLANYEACKALEAEELLSCGSSIAACVSGYDEVNLWIELHVKRLGGL